MGIAKLFTPNLVGYMSDELIKMARQDRWLLFAKNAAKWEVQWAAQMRRFFNLQRDEALDELGNIRKALGDELIDIGNWNVRFAEFGQYLLPRIAEDWGNRELKNLEVGLSFDVLDPNVLDFARTYAFRFSFEVNRETMEALNKQMEEGITAGDGIPQLRKRIQSLFADMNKYRAERIARTEVIRAQNFGAEQSYLQSQVVAYKEWFTAADERRCPFCASLHGRQIRLNNNFHNLGDILESSDGEKIQRLRLDYEEIKRPPLHPHCRCTLIPIVA